MSIQGYELFKLLLKISILIVLFSSNALTNYYVPSEEDQVTCCEASVECLMQHWTSYYGVSKDLKVQLNALARFLSITFEEQISFDLQGVTLHQSVPNMVAKQLASIDKHEAGEHITLFSALKDGLGAAISHQCPMLISIN